MNADEHTQAGSGAATNEARGGVAVVVPSYNHARFVGDCLRSIMRQTHAPSELIVIDDGSTDGSTKIIDRVLRDCPFPCELVARNNRGLCATLNEGLTRTRGDYFAYLGSDDVWLAGFLAARVGVLESRPRAVLAYGHAYLIDEQNRIVDCTCDWAHYADGDARPMLLQTTAPMSPTVVYRRASLARHGWNEASRLEDYDLYLRLSVEGEFAFDARVLAAWRQHGYNTSWNQSMMLDEQLAAQRRLAATLGISPRELATLHTTVSFNRAEDFLRLGQKRHALALMRRNLAGATSARTVAKMLARLVVPYRLMERRRQLLQRHANERYGSIQLD